MVSVELFCDLIGLSPLIFREDNSNNCRPIAIAETNVIGTDGGCHPAIKRQKRCTAFGIPSVPPSVQTTGALPVAGPRGSVLYGWRYITGVLTLELDCTNASIVGFF